MTVQSSCPAPQRLKALIDSQLSDAEQSDLVSHLDSCDSCQLALQDLANGGRHWTDPVRYLDSDKPPADSAFWPTVAGLQRVTPPDLLSLETTAAAPEGSGSSGDYPLDFLTPPEEPGTLGRLERFHVKRVIGRGGMGMVLEALDECLERKVAIKVMDPQLARDETARKRFCREARAAAAVVHENVVTIHQVDIDEAHDLPYLVMQYVAGESLQELLDHKGALPTAEIVRIGQQIAQGLSAAHAQGLVHRDIKPANVLLAQKSEPGSATALIETSSTGNSLASFAVKLTDFGLAQMHNDHRLTQTGFVAGTPLYMAPEQARGEDLDQRTDLFSLGGVLYAMCTGKPPFDASTPYLVLRRVTDEQPKPIEEINPNIPAWLIGLIERLLAKKPADRIQSAGEVSEILAEHLNDIQVPALPPPVPSGNLKPRSGRTPVAGSGLSWWQAALVGVGAFVCLQAALLTSERLGWTHLFAGQGAAELSGSPGPAARTTLQGNGGPIWSMAFSPDGQTLAMGIDDGTVKLWDLVSGEVAHTIHAHQGPIWTLAYSPDGKRLVTASDDGPAKIWDLGTGKEPILLENATPVRAVAFSSDNKTLATGSRKGSIRLWNAQTGEAIGLEFKGHRGVITSIVFGPNGKTLASASGDKTIKLWDVQTGQERLQLKGHTGSVYGLAFARNGKTVASGSWDRAVRLWDAATGDPLAVMKGHSGDVWAVAFSLDSRLLASASEDHTVKLWDVAGKREVVTFKGHTGTVHTVMFSPDGQTVASGGRDGTVKLWDVPKLR